MIMVFIHEEERGDRWHDIGGVTHGGEGWHDDRGEEWHDDDDGDTYSYFSARNKPYLIRKFTKLTSEVCKVILDDSWRDVNEVDENQLFGGIWW